MYCLEGSSPHDVAMSMAPLDFSADTVAGLAVGSAVVVRGAAVTRIYELATFQALHNTSCAELLTRVKSNKVHSHISGLHCWAHTDQSSRRLKAGQRQSKQERGMMMATRRQLW